MQWQLRSVFGQLIEDALDSETDDDDAPTTTTLAEKPNIKTALALHARRRKSLMAPPYLRSAKPCTIHKALRVKPIRGHRFDVLARAMSVIAVSPLVEEHIGLCQELAGIRWGMFARQFNLTSLTAALQQIADKPAVSMMKIGIVMLRLVCAGFIANARIEIALFLAANASNHPSNAI